MSAVLVDREAMLRAEQRAFDAGISAETLMEDAGRQLARLVTQFHAMPGRVLVWAGKGHNGGDALVAARVLGEIGWQVDLRLAARQEQLSPLTFKKLIEIGHHVNEAEIREHPDVILDGLLGIGAAGPLREELRGIAREINRLRKNSNALVVAVDVPSGLDPDTGIPDPDCVRADITACIGFAKSWLFGDLATEVVGRIAVLPLAALREEKNAGDRVTVPALLEGILPRREFDSHKGDHGRVGVVAGSPGYSGAAVLTAVGALRAGAGLVSVFAKPEIYETLARVCPPEVMVRRTEDYREVLESNMDVLAIGPGLGSMERTRDEVRELWRNFSGACVLDADALNLLAKERSDLEAMRGPRLFTPHPGEMQRLFPEGGGMGRRELVVEFTKRFDGVLLLKGARTVVCEGGRNVYFNSTGGPALAKGGSGDVLTGVCAALIAQGAGVRDAAILGAWLCGRASEFAGSECAESVIATEVVSQLGAALSSLRSGCY